MRSVCMGLNSGTKRRRHQRQRKGKIVSFSVIAFSMPTPLLFSFSPASPLLEQALPSSPTPSASAAVVILVLSLFHFLLSSSPSLLFFVYSFSIK